MITWLASYPRSGNTLLRALLKQCFNLYSQSIYDDHELADPAVREIVGHEMVGNNPRWFVDTAMLNNRRLFVKTHELPGADSHPTMYIVRDGRSSVVSYYHYLRNFLGREVALADVISGKVGQNWSAHVRAWAFSNRPNTLVVRYENLVAGKLETLNAISVFIGQPPLRKFDVPFDRLNAMYPQFFRSGSDRTNIAEMDEPSRHLFEELHGETLQCLGYDEDSPRLTLGVRERAHQCL